MVITVSVIKEHRFAFLNIYSICVSSTLRSYLLKKIKLNLKKRSYLFANVSIPARKLLSNELKPKLNIRASISPSAFSK